jgi:sugar phosphate isomerase/epimerase
MVDQSNDRRYTRRQFGRLALGSVPAVGLLAGNPAFAARLLQKQSSVFGGVTIGMIGNLGITATDPASLAAAAAAVGLSAVELGSGGMETFAGAPAAPGRGGGAGGRAGGGAGAPPVPGAAAPAGQAPPAGQAAGGRQGRGPAAPLTPEQEAAQRAYATAIAQWRATAPMDKFREFAKIYSDAGIRIYAFRITLTETMTDAEYDYAFNVAKAVGASSLTMELPTTGALTKRIGDFAAKHRVMTGYHTHLQATPTVFDEALSQSAYNGIQLDIGHYVAATSQSPIPLIERHHSRISSMHLKDRKVDNGANLPWGQGDTPIIPVLQLMKKERYTWPAFIELEYQVPEGSTRASEIGKCLDYCRKALTS